MTKKLNLPKNSVIVITGPTASGKSNLAIELAEEIDSEIISADSRQIYKYMPICTAQPTSEQLNRVPHHLIGFLEPDIEYSAGKFVQDASDEITRLFKKDKIPILCGGSAFYIKALFDGLFEEKNQTSEQLKLEIRAKLNDEYKANGLDNLKKELEQIDPESYNKIELENPHRVIRAIEYFRLNGEKLSEAHANRNANQSNYKPYYFAINHPREELYERINLRCEKMWESGIMKEYENLINLGFDKKLNSLNTVGYKEVELYLSNKLNEDEAKSEFKKNTRRFAKRQLTWFRKNNEINWLRSEDKNKLNSLINILTNEN